MPVEDAAMFIARLNCSTSYCKVRREGFSEKHCSQSRRHYRHDDPFELFHGHGTVPPGISSLELDRNVGTGSSDNAIGRFRRKLVSEPHQHTGKGIRVAWHGPGCILYVCILIVHLQIEPLVIHEQPHADAIFAEFGDRHSAYDTVAVPLVLSLRSIRRARS